MTVPQRRMLESIQRCARTEPGCEKDCPFAVKNEKYCQRALLNAAGKMIETLISQNAELKFRLKDYETDVADP